jgi:hypothetical protein
MSYFENLSVNFQKDGTSDVLGRLKVAEAQSLFDTKTLFDKRDIFFTESLVSGGTSTFIANNSCVDLSVTTTSGSTAIRQTREYFNYQAGKSMHVSISFVLGAKKTNVIKRVGIFDASNGFFLEQDGTNLKIVRRTLTSGAIVDNPINQSSWNIDRLDGTGKSGYTLDETKIQLMAIEYTWQGAGFARFGFYFNNELVVCHEQVFSNVLTTVSITTPCLPVRFEITNSATSASATTFRCICISVTSEGGYNARGISYSIANTSSITIANNASVDLLAIRLKAANNRVPVILKNIGILSTGTTPLRFLCYFNANIVGGTWVSAGTYSAVEYNESITSFTGGELTKSGFVSAQSRQQESLIDSSFKLVSDFAGVSGTFLIVGSAQGGLGNGSARASMDWLEEW